MMFRKTLTLVGMLAATTLAMAPSASAAGPFTMHTDDKAPGARVMFWPDGDRVDICDIEADGYAAWVQVTDHTDSRIEYSYRIGGNGRCQTLRASLGAKYDLVERHMMRFRICLEKDGARHYCDESDWRNVN